MTGGGQEKPKSLTTDEILEVYEHLAGNETSWKEHFAGHGLHPTQVERAMKCMVPSGDGRGQAIRMGFALGLQLGAMRLEKVEYDSSAEPPCNCPACQLRRLLEGEGES